MTLNRDAFYHQGLRPHLGPLTTANVMGFELFLNEAERQKTNLEILAYILATTWWETGKTMQPVREANWVSHTEAGAEAWRKKHLRYYPFYGRSYPQFTWSTNYQKASDVWNKRYKGDGPTVNFVSDPDSIMDPKYGVPLTFSALQEGWFTGRKLGDYVDGVDESDAEDLREYKNARRVVNGTDKATEIARLALIFEHALKDGGYVS